MIINDPKISFLFSCWKERKAVEYSISRLYKHYSDAKVFLFSDGGYDYSYLVHKYPSLYTALEDDTMSATRLITGGLDGTQGNFREPIHQETIYKCCTSVLRRVDFVITNSQDAEWLVMCDPDTLIRGKLTFPSNSYLLGSRVNRNPPQVINDLLANIPGSIPLEFWGASPCIFNICQYNRCLKIFNKYNDSHDFLRKCIASYYALYAHDFLFPLIFALGGIKEVYNHDLVECNRNPFWFITNKKLVHQFRKYY